ncbi:odorant receptor 10-like isoform X2 [Polyergus mexicanus]|uniref:odorant receptor 10-like isoform X2 n=1 Tax=Polyergus mexicanus TaxID=615972 RepID=UPI0038B5BF20
MGYDPMDNPGTIASTYLVDNEYSIQIIRWILKAINLWPRSTDISMVEKARSKFLIFICYFLMIATMVPSGLSIFMESQETFEVKLRSFGPLTFWFMAMINYSCLLMHVDDIRSCVKHVKMDWRLIKKVEERQIMLKNAKIDILYIDNSSVMVRALPYPFYSKILNAHFSPAYEFVFFLQCFSTFVVNSVTVATCGLAAVFVMHACGQLKILMSWLDDLLDGQNEEKNSIKQRFAIIVEHHLRVLRLVSHTERITNIICLVELVGCTMHICLLGYYCIMDWVQDNKHNIISYCIILTSVTFNIFIFCYIGEVLSEQGGQVGKSAYMTNWYLLPGKTALGLVLIILRSNTALKITAGNIVQLSFVTFGDVIKSALAYLNIFRTLIT